MQFLFASDGTFEAHVDNGKPVFGKYKRIDDKGLEITDVNGANRFEYTLERFVLTLRDKKRSKYIVYEVKLEYSL